MYLCLHKVVDAVTATEVNTVADCVNGYVVSASASFADMGSLELLFKNNFSFDNEIFSLIVGSNLVVFVTGHWIGRVISGLKRI